MKRVEDDADDDDDKLLLNEHWQTRNGFAIQNGETDRSMPVRKITSIEELLSRNRKDCTMYIQHTVALHPIDLYHHSLAVYSYSYS